jgi:hypothetical protein
VSARDLKDSILRELVGGRVQESCEKSLKESELTKLRRDRTSVRSLEKSPKNWCEESLEEKLQVQSWKASLGRCT